MEHIQGIVEAISNNKVGQYGLLIDGQWYNGYGEKPEHLRNKYVSLGIEVKGNFKNIKSTTELNMPESLASPELKVHEEMIHDPKPIKKRSRCKLHAVRGDTIEYISEQYNAFGEEQEIVASQILVGKENLLLFMYYKA